MAELEKTLALLKPDSVRAGKAQEIMQLIELNGFTIVAKQKMQLTRARAEEFYGEHNGKEFFPKLVSFMTSGPIWALVLAKPGAILGWRALMGPTNVFKARAEQPKCLRALYGTDGTQNATHGSDSPASAAREIKFFFPALVPDPVSDPTAAADYITTRIQPALSKALAALSREKPSADKFEAITFIASYLLQNNPNKPKVLLPDEWDPALMSEEEDDEAEFINARRVGGDTAPPPPAQPPPPPAYTPPAPAPARAPTPPPAAPAPSSRPSSARPTSARPASGGRPPSATPPPPPPPPAEPEPDAAALELAATKVQAAYRGYHARREVAVMRAEATAQRLEQEAITAAAEPSEEDAAAAEPPPPAEDEAAAEPEASGSGAPGPAEGIEFPLGVTEEMANEAAVRVQAHMRGYLARKQVAELKAQQAAGAGEASVAVPAEGEGFAEGEGVGEGQGYAEGEGAGEGQGDGYAEGEGAGESEAQGYAEGEGAGESEAQGYAEGEGAGESEAQGNAEGEGAGESEAQGNAEGEGAGEGEAQGYAEGEGVGEGEGEAQGYAEGEGAGEGQGEAQGYAEGEGAGEGQGEGQGEGYAEGEEAAE